MNVINRKVPRQYIDKQLHGRLLKQINATPIAMADKCCFLRSFTHPINNRKFPKEIIQDFRRVL